jgi:hypothetical protein
MDWMPINPDLFDELAKGRREAYKGVHFMVTVSPYSIPEAVRGSYNEAKRLFEIRFRYLDEESHKRRKVDDHVCILEGEHSGRLLGIDVDVDTLGVETISVAVRALGKLAGTAPKRRKSNYEAARKVIDSKKKELLAGA